MKRTRTEGNNGICEKKVKLASQVTELNGDVVYTILCFMDSPFLIQVGMKVSKLWSEQALMLPLTVHASSASLEELPVNIIRNITDLKVNDWLPESVCSAMVKHMNKLESLEIGPRFNPKCFNDIVISPNMSKLTRLHLDQGFKSTGRRVPLDIAKLESCELKNLTELSLCYTNVDDVKPIVNGPFKQLVHLSLSNNGVTDEGLKLLISSNLLQGLKLLNLSFNPIEDISPLFDCKMDCLTDLDISFCSFVIGEQCENCSMDIFKNLTSLNLAKTPVFSQMLGKMISNMKQITSLNLFKSGCSVVALDCPAVSNLKTLNITDNMFFVDNEVKYLVGNQYLTNLKELILDVNTISDANFKLIATSPYLKQLTSLSLRMTDIGLEGVKHLHHLVCLERLNLRSNHIDNDCAVEIVNSGLSKLTWLDVSDNRHLGIDGLNLLISRIDHVVCENIYGNGEYDIDDLDYCFSDSDDLDDVLDDNDSSD